CRVGVGGVGEGGARRLPVGGAPAGGGDGGEVPDRGAEAGLLVGHRRRSFARLGEQGAQEVLRLGVLLQPAHEVGDGDVEVLGGDDGGVEEDGAHRVLHGPCLGGGHALEHLDVEHGAHAAPLGEEVGQGDVVE